MATLNQRISNGEFVDLRSLSGVFVDLRYGSEDNFLGRAVYPSGSPALLHRVAFERLSKSLKHLKAARPDLGFLIFDALRPRQAQWKLWNAVVNTPQQKYIGDPQRGSIHNFGFAIDLTLWSEPEGRELDMGTAFDHFSELAEPQKEMEMLAQGRLAEQHIQNRKTLRAAMEFGGFSGIPHEWWHFEALDRTRVREDYTIIEEW